MYVDTSTLKRNGKTYTRHLLRISYRENGKVRKKTLLNISDRPEEEVEAIKLALKNKKKLTTLVSIDEIETTAGKSIAAVWTAKVIAERLGIKDALGDSQEAKAALLQVIARLVDQGSRLSAVRFATRHAVCEILGIEKLNEHDLYRNLRWLAEEQERIEQELFRRRFADSPPTLFLYDVTSSYFEGNQNELAKWGYNRDKKRGKKQIVLGLLTGPDGLPVAVRVFAGNANDTQTVADQVQILASKFGVQNVTLVGDRGMLKGPQIEDLPEGFRYITAISKPQIQKLLSCGTLQYELFSDKVCEVDADGLRFILRRNPVRAEEMAANRADKESSIIKLAGKETAYLQAHPRASADTAKQRVAAKIKRLKVEKWLTVCESERTLEITRDEQALEEAALLDGCYVIKSDLPKEDADAQTLHDRYCDLEMVERTFRTMKTTHLDLRPIFVRKAENTRGHALVVMLSLLVQRELERCWKELNVTVQEGLDELSAINMLEVRLRDAVINDIPKPTELGAELLKNADVVMPEILPSRKASVSTTKTLQSERI